MKRAQAEVRAPMTDEQVHWLGALLLAVQFPQAFDQPVWVAVAGIGLVVVRLLLTGRVVTGWKRLLVHPPSYVLALLALGAAFALRHTFGYFLGRDPCVAFLFVLVGIKYFEARSPRDGTLLICLASFLMVTLFFYNQSIFAAGATLPGLVLLAVCLQSLAPPAATKSRIGDPLRRSARLLLEGIPMALLLFVLFPRLSAPLWGLPSDFSAKSGLSDRMAPGMISQLSLSDAVAFRVDFAGAVPLPDQRYWRGPVLAQFDGVEWTPALDRLGGRLAPSRGGEQVLYTVTLEPHYKTWLFALDLPAALPRSADPATDDGGLEIASVTRDQQLIARAVVTQPLRYTQLSRLGRSYPGARGEFGELERAESLQLPAGSRRTRAFARELRAAYQDDASLVRAVLTWFHEEHFVYTLAPTLLEYDAIDRFLFDTRRGFCEHYASAFVVLLRAAGIPARVVTGYQGGQINPNGGYLIVRQSDAHAWAEALIDGQWRRFDPTAAVAPSRIELGLGGALPAEDRVPFLARMQDGWFKGVELAWDALNHDWRRHVVGFNFVQQQNLWRYWQLDRWAAWQMVVAGALFTAAWAGGLLMWFALRHYQRDDRATTLWNALCARLARAGLPREPHEGPLTYAARAAARWPAFTAAFAVIGESYAALRYGPPPGSHAERQTTLERLGHAIAVLPAPRKLRRGSRFGLTPAPAQQPHDDG